MLPEIKLLTESDEKTAFIIHIIQQTIMIHSIIISKKQWNFWEIQQKKKRKTKIFEIHLKYEQVYSFVTDFTERYKEVVNQMCFSVYQFRWYSEKSSVAELTFGMASGISSKSSTANTLWSTVVLPDIKLWLEKEVLLSYLSEISIYLS